jgi:6-phosphogluconolactonase
VNSFRISGGRVEVWRDVAEISERAAELLIGIARQTVDARGKFELALSGGSTPTALYELLATEAKSARVPWQQTHVYWSDERCVPPTDQRSNYRMAYQSLLSHVPVPEQNIHRMRGEDEPESAARTYANELEKEFGPGAPRFPLILLGMGDDGHTASLFPGSPALRNLQNTVAATYVEKFKEHRLTMTLRTLNAAETIIFMVAGESKAAALSKLLDDRSPGSDSLPAKLVRQTNGELIWLVDESAARLIGSR